MGQSGVIPVTKSGTTALLVGEPNSVNSAPDGSSAGR